MIKIYQLLCFFLLQVLQLQAQTPPPPGQSCYDELLFLGLCPEYANRFQLCNNPTFESFMRQNCQGSCPNLCPPTQPPPVEVCVDHPILQLKCPEYGRSGFCNNPIHQDYLRRYCNGTCRNLCVVSGWGPWRNVSGCTVSCGSGTLQQVRDCFNANGCAPDTYGGGTRFITCNTQPCSMWGPWRNVSDCSVTCGRGTQQQERDCIGGTDCVPDLYGAIRFVLCNTQPCSMWGPWRNVSDCSVTCGGGVQQQERDCINGTDCVPDPYGATRNVSCNTQPCPRWGPWRNVGSCSVTCGGGVQQQERDCIGGTDCVPDPYGATRNVSCNTQNCSMIWSDWKNLPCTAKCGGGSQVRTRYCLSGSDCPGNRYEVLSCNNDPCGTPNGILSPWGEWSACCYTCGAGLQTRTRVCSEAFCSENIITLVRGCNVQSCPNSNKCSRLCGEGTAVSGGAYDDCTDVDCFQQSCPSNYLLRYGKKNDECCDNSVASTCGIRRTGSRIVGGTNANILDWPWMVQISITFSTGVFGCGGSVISPEYVITAAHCVVLNSENATPSNVMIRVGTTTFGQTTTATQTSVASQIFIHPSYQSLFSGDLNDIAVLQVAQPFDLTGDSVKPICLPQGERVYDDLQCAIAGWGDMVEGASPAVVLQQAEVRIIPNAFCSIAYPIFDSNIMLCAGKIAGGIDACQGDSGGPIMCQRCSSCEWFLAGVTSFGTGCARPMFPGVYARVIGFNPWLLSVLPSSLVTGSGGKPSCL